MNYDDRYRQQQEEDRRREDQRRQDEQRHEEQRRDELRREEIRRQDEQRRLDELRREQQARDEQVRRDLAAAFERNRELDEQARAKKRDLDARSAQLKQDLDDRARQLKDDLWDRKYREQAAQDEAFRRIELEKQARRLAAHARESASARSATAPVGEDVFDVAAREGMNSILSLLGLFGSATSPSNPLELTLPMVSVQIEKSDLDAEHRALLLEAVTRNFEAWRQAREDKMEFTSDQTGQAAPVADVIDEPWNKLIGIKKEEKAEWTNIPGRFPKVRLLAKLSEQEKTTGEWGDPIELTAFVRPLRCQGQFDVRHQFILGFVSSPLFVENKFSTWILFDDDGKPIHSPFTIDPFVEAFLSLRGLPNETVTNPQIQMEGKLEYVDALLVLRDANLYAFNAHWRDEAKNDLNPEYRQRLDAGEGHGPGNRHLVTVYPYCYYVDSYTSDDQPLPIERLTEMRATGEIFRYTYTRLFRMRRKGLDAAYANGKALSQQLYDELGFGSKTVFQRLWKERFGAAPSIEDMVGVRAEGRKYVEETFPNIRKSRRSGWFSWFGRKDS